MRIRLHTLPDPRLVEDYDLRRFRPGETYDVTPQLASLLIVGGYAETVLPRQERNDATNRTGPA